MTAEAGVAAGQISFEDVQVGQAFPAREFGPLTIEDTVRWAGLQENWARLHFDRDYAREHSGQRSFIASGAYRQALLVRTLTDWIGPRGRLTRLSVRQTYPTTEGDLMRYTGAVSRKSDSHDDPWVECDLKGTNQDDREILSGRCTVMLPSRSH